MEDASSDAPLAANDASDSGTCQSSLSGTDEAILDPAFTQPDITALLPNGTAFTTVLGAVGPAGDVFLAFGPAVGGSSTTLLHLSAAGVIDTAFGSGGTVTLPWYELDGLLVDASGEVVVSGAPRSDAATTDTAIAIAGVHADGTPGFALAAMDTGWNVYPSPPFAGTGGFLEPIARGLALITSDGQISTPSGWWPSDLDTALRGLSCVTIGTARWYYIACDAGVWRYGLDGTLDSTFSAPSLRDAYGLQAGGDEAIDVGAADSTLYVLPSAGTSIAHLLNDGTPDPAFGLPQTPRVAPLSKPLFGTSRCDGSLLLAEWASQGTSIQFQKVTSAGAVGVDGSVAAATVAAAGTITLPVLGDSGVLPALFPLAADRSGAMLALEVVTPTDGTAGRARVLRILPAH